MDAARELDGSDMWRAMSRLLERFAEAVDRDTFLDECLDGVVEALDADRGLVVLIGPDGERHPVNARQAGRALSAKERQEVSETLIREAHERGATVVWPPDDASTPSASIMDLSIACALAVPLRDRGVLYVDFRDPRRVVDESHRELLEAAAVLVGSVLEQSEQLLRTREELREARIELPGDLRGPSLEELLRPPSMEALRRDVLASVHGDSPLLIVGESGTGKTLLATAIAEVSGRTPVVRAMLGAADDLNTITSELFGHERGSFSGAIGKRVGVVEHADGGTLILDEVLNLPMKAQQLLLDFTQFGTYRPLGWSSAEPKRASVRIIGATHGDLRAAVAEGRFREDLYYRLAGSVIELPPLRDRRGETPALATGFLERLDPVRSWSLEVPLRRLLVSSHLTWPGNIRQLEAIVRRGRERALLRDPSTSTLLLEDLTPRDFHLERLPDGLGESGPEVAPASSDDSLPAPTAPIAERASALETRRAELEAYERALLADCLEKHRGVVARAARELGMSRTSLVSRLRTLGIDDAG